MGHLLPTCLNMRILVISQYFYPEQFRINDIVRELVKRGHNVTVVTGLPNYPEGKIYDGYEDAYKTTSVYEGAVVYRCNLRPRKSGFFNLGLNYISFVNGAKRVLKKIKPDFDIIYVYEVSPIFQAIPAIKHGKKYNIPVVLYNMDVWPECVRDRETKPMSKANPIYLIAKHYSKYIYRNVDLILNKCDDFSEYLGDMFGISAEKMLTLPEHAEGTYLSVKDTPLDNGIIDFMFLGNIGKSQNCEMILDAFTRIDSSSAALHFVGSGSALPSLKLKAKQLSLQNVYFYGQQSLEKVIDYYNLADVCVLALSNKTVSGLTPPGKLFSYMAANRLVLASINGSSQTIIDDSKCGYYCEADNCEELSYLMQNILSHPNLINSLGKNGREYFIKHYTIENHIRVLDSIFQSMVVKC